MAWLEKFASTINVNIDGIKAIHPFEAGRTYSQLDLDGYDGVLGVARKYSGLPVHGFFAENIVNQLNRQRERDLGSVAIYVKSGETGEPVAGYAFIAHDCGFTPQPPVLETI